MGSRNGASVLTEDDVIRLRRQAASGIPQKNLAREYGIAPETVSRIVTRKTWTHV
jgi:plasmid maintenance system antidote protein VapI